MALVMYDKCYVFAKGAVLGESSGGSLEYQGDPIPVETLIKELGGFTPVPKKAMLSVDSFVPTTGLDFDAIKAFLNTEFITFGVKFGGSGLGFEADGAVMAPSITWSATDSTKLSFRAMIEAKPIE